MAALVPQAFNWSEQKGKAATPKPSKFAVVGELAAIGVRTGAPLTLPRPAPVYQGLIGRIGAPSEHALRIGSTRRSDCCTKTVPKLDAEGCKRAML